MGKHQKVKTKAEKLQNRILATSAVIGTAVLTAHGLSQTDRPEATASHVESVQEQFILGALKNADIVTNDSVSLLCLPDTELGTDGKGNVVQGRVPVDKQTGELTSRLEISQSACDAIVAYASATDRSEPSVGMAAAIDVVVHEAEHVTADSTDEAEVSCIAFQKIGAFAAALGASPAEVAALEAQNLEVYHNGRPESYQTAACYDTGPYDANPGSPGVFPFDKPN